VLLFGEDIGPKGGVHAVTLGLQEKYGHDRVFDTSLNEEGIVGRAVGMALAGLMPVPEIQFRKYAEPATEQINDCGTMRWRTHNRFAAPMVLRIPGGFFKCGDPWHSQTNEVQFVHNPGWLVAVPSNAEDAVGLLRAGLRGNDPVIFFEHRAMLDDSWARRPWPGDDYVLPFGRAKKTSEGDDITIVTWGAMVPRCEEAAKGVRRRHRPSNARSVGQGDGARERPPHPPLPDRPRGSEDRRLRRRDRRDRRRRGLPRPRRPGRPGDHAGHPQPAQSGASQLGGSLGRADPGEDRRIGGILMGTVIASEAKQSRAAAVTSAELDCRVAALLAMTGSPS
jgi:hypothetical protein